jgi:hypothetical protein
LIAFIATHGIAFTQNMFAIDRARVTLASQLRRWDSETSVNNGWEYSIGVDLEHA